MRILSAGNGEKLTWPLGKCGGNASETQAGEEKPGEKRCGRCFRRNFSIQSARDSAFRSIFHLRDCARLLASQEFYL